MMKEIMMSDVELNLTLAMIADDERQARIDVMYEEFLENMYRQYAESCAYDDEIDAIAYGE